MDLQVRPGAIRADAWHEAGANAVQELGYALAAGVERLAESRQTARGHGRPRDRIRLRVGADVLHRDRQTSRGAHAVGAGGGRLRAGRRSSCRMRLAVRTARRNKSVYDRYTNLLRVTTEALSAAVGGCDRLTVEPFGFEPHLALNVQRILKEEAHMDAVADPAGGSYYIEALTDALAREAWKLFQQVEGEGGYGKALASGSVEKAIWRKPGRRAKRPFPRAAGHWWASTTIPT